MTAILIMLSAATLKPDARKAIQVFWVYPTIVKGHCPHTGQTCSAGSRLLLQKGVHDAFLKALAEARSCGPVFNKYLPANP
ncbi:hypothetical protein W822_01655 [Advenella kashmirensis W13003]|uniref:Aldehyde dehydrogenase domain-containing protein n=1 Tax=Advenella kashmirensis W13003 TaxID=1424334 RepID=V8QZC1_9BURK|nr:aldehyde dehydrogenase family protein [Advenella kashmirensis]ETF04660.1 hypothetical protein W822_01655 [Advenella kashmirensis W13003]